MKLKHIASYILLLIYSVSFGHQIIPHHHHEKDANHNHHHSGVHDHCIAEKETHNHVAHNNHFDEGLIDYLACILGNHQDHSSTECEFTDVQNKQRNKTNKRFSTLLGVLVFWDQPNFVCTLNTELARIYCDVFYVNTPKDSYRKRGPPNV